MKEKNEYPMLTSSWELNSKIIKKDYSSYFNNRGIHFKTSEGEGFFFPTSCNYDYKEYLLSRFVQEGDSICKKEGSDTIYIYRNNEKYYFILGKQIQKGE